MALHWLNFKKKGCWVGENKLENKHLLFSGWVWNQNARTKPRYRELFKPHWQSSCGL